MIVKKEQNYLEYIPKINKKWELNENGVVEISVENIGFFNTLAQKLFKKPRFSFISLDEYGSFVWQNIDGEMNILEIGKVLEENHKEASNQLYERLSKFMGILESNSYIVFLNKK